MTSERRPSLWSDGRRIPADLAVTVVFAIATCIAALVPEINSSPFVIPLIIPFSLFLPGYVLIVALFPERGLVSRTDAPAGEDPASDRRLDGIARVTLSVALSAVIVPLIGMGLVLAGVGLKLYPIALSITAVIVGGAAIAARRRGAVSPDRRFRVPFTVWLAVGQSRLEMSGNRTNLAINMILVLSLILAAASGAYAVMGGDTSNGYSEFYLLGENESGEHVAEGYPSKFQIGQSKPLTVAINNHEQRDVNYTVVVLLQRVDVRNGSVDVRTQTHLDRVSVTVEEGQRSVKRLQITPQSTGNRLQLLLYRGDAPDEQNAGNAYRSTHLWINMTASG